MKTLAELADDRREVEQKITAQYAAKVATDAEHAEHYRTLHMLHEELASVLEATETASWSYPYLAGVSLGGALRWAVIGAARTGEWHRDQGIAWQKLADGPGAR